MINIRLAERMRKKNNDLDKCETTRCLDHVKNICFDNVYTVYAKVGGTRTQSFPAEHR